ncbi:hypothetical protein HPB50_012980 [Hyalomma asiaticum]|uniref:Uncharacterized protein n=1 Tax=Hyalomma asiaticum TaxID=266040 RepID=A0ACB7SM69_HYAAI|nr:hypothetical protein HPB50_012980 [Hyalomma asiaticum]
MESTKKEPDASKHARHSRRSKSVTKSPPKGHDGDERLTPAKSRKRKKSAAHKRSSGSLSAARSPSAIDRAPHETAGSPVTQAVPIKEQSGHDDSVHPGSEKRHSVGSAQHNQEQAVSRTSGQAPQSSSAAVSKSTPPDVPLSLSSSPEEPRLLSPPGGQAVHPPAVVSCICSAATDAEGMSHPAPGAADRALWSLVSGGEAISTCKSFVTPVAHSDAATPFAPGLGESRISVATEASSAGVSAQRSRGSINTTRSAYRRSLQMQGLNEAIKERAAIDRRESTYVVQQPEPWRRTVSKSCVAMAVVAWVGGVLLLLIAVYVSRRSHDSRPCSTSGCVEFARSLRESINTSVQPCENFGRFVCDGWTAKYRLTVHEQAFVKVMESIGPMLLSVPVSADQQQQDTKQKAALFYKSCDAVRRGETNELPNVVDALHNEGIVWPHRSTKPDVLHAALRSSLVLHWGAPFDVTLKTRGRQVMVHLEAFEMFASLRDKFVTSARSSERKAYFDTLCSHFKANEDNLLNFDEVNDLDVAAYTTLPKSVRATRHAVTLDEEFVFAGNNIESRDHWHEVLRPLVPLNETERMVFSTRTESFVRAVWEFWSVQGEESMHVFVSWCVVQVAALFANQQLQANFYGSKEEAQFHQGASCLAKAFLISGTAVFSDYNKLLFKGKALVRAHILVHSLRSRFLHRLRKWKHFDAGVKIMMDRDATEKPVNVVQEDSVVELNDETADMRGSLVHKWQNTPTPDTTSISLRSSMYSAIEAAKMLVLVDKDFHIMPYAFAFPYFHRSATDALNYAGAGGTTAFALAKLFLEAYGTSAAGNTSLEASLRCFENSSNYMARDHSEVVMLRAIAASLSFEAYDSEWVSWGAAVQNLEDYSGAQLFFMASCYALCPGSAMGHNDGEQCNAHLQNLEGFARAFACAPDAKMSPPAKCSVMRK